MLPRFREYHLTARYLYRKHLALKLLRDISFQSFLEVGFGNGDFMMTLARMGYTGWGVDLSAEAVRRAQARIQCHNLQGRIKVQQGDLSQGLSGLHFELVVTFEVLEHIPDEYDALRHLWLLVSPGGHLLLSVPAHQAAWGASDLWAGHWRRYEWDELASKLGQAGFEVREHLSYGFPLINMTRWIRDLLFRKHLGPTIDPHQQTVRSGVEQIGPIRLFSYLAPLYFQLARVSGLPFLRTDLGEGYVALARKPPQG